MLTLQETNANLDRDETLNEALLKSQQILTEFAVDEEFAAKVALAFGDGFDGEKLERLRQRWESGNFEEFPRIEVRSSAELNGANGAFAAATNTIYLSAEYLEEKKGNLGAIVDVVVEEYGHFVDAQVNEFDAPGDEGEIFSALVEGLDLGESALQKLKTENDTVVIALDGKVVQIEQQEFTGQFTDAIQAVDGLLGTLQKGTNDRVFGESIPIVGDSLKNSSEEAVQFIEKIRTAIHDKLSAVTDLTNATVEDIQNALNEALGSSGLDLLKQTIEVVDSTDEVVFDLKLGSNITNFSTSLASNFGIPGVGFELSGDAEVDLGFDFNLKLGANKTEGFFIDTSANDELTVELNASTPNLKAKGKLGFLNLTVTDQGTNFGGTFTVDLMDSGGRLTQAEIPSVDLTSLVDAKLSGDADVNLNLATSFEDSAKFPKLSSDFNLDWHFDASDIDHASFGDLPTVGFNNVKLDLGSFLSDFAKPIVEQVRHITRPLEPIIDVITTNLPLLDEFGINISLLSIAKKFAPELGLIDAIPKIVTAAKALDSIDTAAGSVLLDLGGFTLPEDIRQIPNLSGITLNPSNIILPTLGNPLEQATGKSTTASSFFAGAQGGGLSFPIIEDPQEVFKLFLGKIDATLFLADLPTLSAQFEYKQTLPVFPGVNVNFGGNGGFGANLDFGFDTEGLFAAASSGNAADIFNKGFFVDANSGFNVNLGFKAGAGVGITGAAELNADIFIDGTVDFKLNDPTPGDGKVRPSEILQNLSKGINCVFDTTGKVEAGAEVSYELFWVFDDSFEIARFPIPGLNFAFGCDTPGSTKNLVLATDLGSNLLRLNMGLNARDRGSGTPFIDEINEVFEVQPGANPGQVLVSAFGYIQPYPTTSSSVDKIIADGGTGDDAIIIQAGVVAELELTGGEGNDVLKASDSSAVLHGGLGNDGLDGSSQADRIFGEDGDDALKGGAGDDSLEGGAGQDIVAGDAGADTLRGGTDDDKINGGDDNDVAFGESGNDRLSGNNGNDVLDGGIGLDILYGNVGDDTLNGDSEPDFLNGNEGNDSLVGGTGNDTLRGGFRVEITQIGFDEQGQPIFSEPKFFEDLGQDSLEGEEGNDILESGAGDDLLVGGAGNDSIDGGNDLDTVSYLNSPAGVTVNIDETNNYNNPGFSTDLEPIFTITAGTALDGFGTQDTLRNLENIIGSEHDDILIGNSQDNQIQALAGNDLLIGNAGNDRLDGGDGIDAVSYRRDPGAVTINLAQNQAQDGFGNTDELFNIENVIGSAFGDRIIGDDNNNVISAGGGNDTVSGAGGNDTLFGEEDNDVLNGDAGNDLLIGGSGIGWPSDFLNGGDGSDTASYFTAPSGVSASLLQKNGWAGDATGDQFDSIENLEGSNFDDFLVGDNGNNSLRGLAGKDELDGGLGDDTLKGDDGNDVLWGNDGNDHLAGDAGNDILRGGMGNDVLDGAQDDNTLEGGLGDDTLTAGEGNNRLDAGEGNNTVTAGNGNNTVYAGPGNDAITLGNGNNQVYAGEGENTITSGQGDNLIYGGSKADIITVGDGDNQIYAAEGNNVITTGDGNNSINTLHGNDTIYGGAAGDRIETNGGDDLIYAAEGDNYIDAGSGNNTVYSGSGSDLFVLNPGDGMTVIAQFDVGKDLLKLQNGLTFDRLSITQGNNGNEFFTQISIAGSNDLLATLKWVQAQDITSQSFAVV